ncbi:hypothetical protein ACEZDB_23015 [Streptacidiphilus sp. N1-3]|uniref:Membrane protein YfcA n=1 Tax=Streptacidiphilus alkalitolerans TaxID=3342712 RepID=A0ABV6X691_9ACTN
MSDNYSGSPIFPAEDPYNAPQQAPAPAWVDAEPTALLPPVPPQAPSPGWDEAQPPPSSHFSQIHEKYATTEVPLPPQAFEQQGGFADPSWPDHWTQQPASQAPPQAPPTTWQPQAAPPQQFQQPQTAQPQAFPQAPAGWVDAEPTALLPPVPAGYAEPPPYQGHPQAQAQPYPQPEPLAPGATGWSDAPLAYGVPSSLRETFAAAQPTGPAGSFAPPPPSPLDLQPPGGSLREAFAAAQPTGPSAAGYETPAFAPAPAATAPAARSGSPIIDPGIQPAAATLALAVLLALAALLGRFGLVVPVLLLQAVTAAGWFRLNGMWPARQGIALAALGGFTADAAALAASGGTAPAVLAGTLGGFFLLVLILQIFRPSNPDERFYALTVSASATVMTVLAGCFLAAGSIGHGGWSSGAVVVAGALSAGVATAVSALPMLQAKLDFAAGAVAGLIAGALLGAFTGIGLGGGLLLGLAAGCCALVGRRVAAYDFPSRFVHLTAGVVLPLACAAPAAFLVGHLLAR